jgi:hypothetical protein
MIVNLRDGLEEIIGKPMESIRRWVTWGLLLGRDAVLVVLLMVLQIISDVLFV